MKTKYPFLNTDIEIPKSKLDAVDVIRTWLSFQTHLPKLNGEYLQISSFTIGPVDPIRIKSHRFHFRRPYIRTNSQTIWVENLSSWTESNRIRVRQPVQKATRHDRIDSQNLIKRTIDNKHPRQIISRRCTSNKPKIPASYVRTENRYKIIGIGALTPANCTVVVPIIRYSSIFSTFWART